MPHPNTRLRSRRPLLASALLLMLPTCGTTSTASTEYRADGTVVLRCRASLPSCLQRADDVCHGARYRVLQATDDRDYSGPAGLGETEVRASEAVIRCGPRGSPVFLFGAGASKGATAAAAAGAPPPPALRACIPGVTQACFGPGACRGGQACLADGSGFGACACTPPTAADGGASPAP